MPPEQCPECGRFLAADLVASLSSTPAPCPGCAAELTSDDVRSPAPEHDALEGWDDAGVAGGDLPPFPHDPAWIAAGAAFGALLGVLTRRRVCGMLGGAAVGAGVVAGLRRIWTLQD